MPYGSIIYFLWEDLLLTKRYSSYGRISSLRKYILSKNNFKFLKRNYILSKLQRNYKLSKLQRNYKLSKLQRTIKQTNKLQRNYKMSKLQRNYKLSKLQRNYKLKILKGWEQGRFNNYSLQFCSLNLEHKSFKSGMV